MNSNLAYDDQENTLNNKDDLGMEIVTKGYSGSVPVSSGTRSMTERETELRAPPGPSSSKERYRARSRSDSASSASSRTSSNAATMAAERKSRREIAQEANRLAIAEARKREKENPVIVIAPESESTAEEEMGPPAQEDHSRKRKLAVEEDTEEVTIDGAQRKQGRPRTTGLYIGRAKAVENLNEKKREAAALMHEEALRKMSTGQIFAQIERDLDEAVDELNETTTADIAQHTRECMAEVIKVAKSSKNLKGGFVKILKHAAVVGSASAEVLRTRADSANELDNDNDTQRQLKALRRELAQVKRETQLAKEEAEKAKEEAERLRKELEEVRGRRGTRERRRTYTRDSPSPPPPPASDKGQKEENHAEQAESAAIPIANAEEVPMEVDDMVEGEPQAPEYSDERRRREILPPEEEWPLAWRPPIKGVPKILDEGPLIGHKVKMVEDGRPGGKGNGTRRGTRQEEAGSAQKLMDQLAPLLENWLRENLKSLGIQTGKDNTTPAPSAKTKGKGGDKMKGIPNPPQRPKASGVPAAEVGARGSTTTPNMKLWKDGAGDRTGDRGTPVPPTYQQIVTRSEGAPTKKNVPASAQLGKPAWTVVGKKGKPSKDAPPPR